MAIGTCCRRVWEKGGGGGQLGPLIAIEKNKNTYTPNNPIRTLLAFICVRLVKQMKKVKREKNANACAVAAGIAMNSGLDADAEMTRVAAATQRINQTEFSSVPQM